MIQDSGIGRELDIVVLQEGLVHKMMGNRIKLPIKEDIKWINDITNEVYTRDKAGNYKEKLDINPYEHIYHNLHKAITPAKLDRVYATEIYVDKLYADLIEANKILVKKLEAAEASIGKLTTQVATIEKAYINSAQVNDLIAKYLKSGIIEVNQLVAKQSFACNGGAIMNNLDIKGNLHTDDLQGDGLRTIWCKNETSGKIVRVFAPQN